MVRIACVVVLALMAATPVAAGQTKTSLNAREDDRPVATEARQSGRIVEAATDGSSILLEEMVAWTGPGTGMLTRRVRITPQTSHGPLGERSQLHARMGQHDDRRRPLAPR